MKKLVFGLGIKLAFSFLVCALWSCSTGTQQATVTFEAIDQDTLHHARGFEIERSKDAIRLTVINPWKEGEVLARYYLVKRDTNRKTKPVYADGATIEIPLHRAALTSCTQIGFVDRLNETKSIIGISYPERVFHQGVKEQIRKGETIDLGDPFQLDVERLLSCRPEVVFMSGYNQQGDYEKNVTQSGVTVVYINEWIESSALARAEWIRFIGYFYGKEGESEPFFDRIEQEYMALCDSIKQKSTHPKVLSGEDFRGSWYMAKADNWMSRLYVDAGANYPLANEPGTGSQSFALEEVYKRFSDSDKWMGVDARSLHELKEKDARYANFNAFKKGEVYHFNKRGKAGGANDFWERGVVDPAGLLRDLITIFHEGNAELRYTERLLKD